MHLAAEVKRRVSADRLWFPRNVLGHVYWSKQVELYRAMHDRTRVASKGGHSTGKTHAAAGFVTEWATTHPGAKVVLLGPKFEQVEINLWAAVRKCFTSARCDLGGRLNATSWHMDDDWWIRVAGANKPESLHLGHGSAMLVVVDEAVGLEPWAWEPINSMLASADSRLVVLFNPTQSAHKTREICDDPSFRVVTLSCEDHPNVVSGSDVYPGAVTKAWVDEFRGRVERGLATEDEYRARVKGEFPTGASDALVTASDLEKSLTATATDVPRLALDVARFGADRNVLAYCDGKRTTRIVDEWSGQDLMFTAGRLMRAVRELGVAPGMTFVDACGVGGGVVDRCAEAGVPVVGVDAGSKATGRWSHIVGRETPFANRRAELFWTLRCLTKSGGVNVDRAFWSDLGMVRVGYRGTDLAIRSKEDMRKEYGRSPDRADALALLFSEPREAFTMEVWS